MGLLRGFSGIVCVKHFEQCLAQSKLLLLSLYLYYYFREYGLKHS